MANFTSVNMLQINLKRSREVQDLAIQTTRERDVGILVILEQNRDLHDATWFKDKRWFKDEHYRAREVISGNGYVGAALGQLAIFSCYFSPNVTDVLVELDLAALEQHIRKWKGVLSLAGDFNAKTRAWIGGPRDPWGDPLEEMMAAYLIVANQRGVHTYETGIARLLRPDICISESHK